MLKIVGVHFRRVGVKQGGWRKQHVQGYKREEEKKLCLLGEETEGLGIQAYDTSICRRQPAGWETQ